MQVHITFYGRLKQDTGTRQEQITLAGDTTTIQFLINDLVMRYPALGDQLSTVAFTIGAELVPPDRVVQDGDRVGFLPPVSGG